MATYDIFDAANTVAGNAGVAAIAAAVVKGRLSIELDSMTVADPDSDITATYEIDATGNPHLTITFSDIS